MGSVMRRNTSEAIGETKTRTWRRKGKSRETVLEENEDEWEPTRARRPSQYRIDPIPGDEGDAGIGRPYNVAVRHTTGMSFMPTLIYSTTCTCRRH